MKKLVVLLVGSVLLAVAAVETLVRATAPVVMEAEDILSRYFSARQSLPPIPPPVSYSDVASQLSEDRFDFLSSPNWGFAQDGGVIYLSSESKLKLTLPMRLVAYEDLVSGKVVLAGTPEGAKKTVTLAIVDAPDFSQLDEKTSVGRWLTKEFWPRRVIWSARLEEEAAWYELLSVEQTLLSAQSMQAEMPAVQMMMSETVADFRLIQENTTNLSVNLPEEFAGATVYLQSSTNLIEGIWATVLQTNAVTNGVMFLTAAEVPDLIESASTSTNLSSCQIHTIPDTSCTNCTAGISTNSTSQSGGVIYYRTSASSHVDSDNDGLDNVSEYGAGTDWMDEDSENDGLLDGQDVAFGFDPLKKDTNDDGTPDVFEVLSQVASNGVLVVLPDGQCRHAQESSLNLESYGAYGD